MSRSRLTALSAVVVTVFLFWSRMWAQGVGFLSAHGPWIVVLCAGAMTALRYAPGSWLYCMVVLNEPQRHTRTEIRRATAFASDFGKRVLLAGLALTLVDIATASQPVFQAAEMPCSLFAALPTFLYAVLLYAFAEKASRVAVEYARN